MSRKKVDYTVKCSEIISKLELGQVACIDGGGRDDARDFVYKASKTGRIHCCTESVWYCCGKDVREDGNIVWIIAFITRETAGVSKRYSPVCSGFLSAMTMSGYELDGRILFDAEYELPPKSFAKVIESIQRSNAGSANPMPKIEILPNHIRKDFRKPKGRRIYYYPYIFKIAFCKKVTPAKVYEDSDVW